MSVIPDSSIIRITSNDPDNKRFGTGFVIKQDKNFSYVLTCAHVVRDVGGEGRIQVGKFPAEFIACGPPGGIDLAVLRVKNFAEFSLLSLKISGNKGMSFCLRGFCSFDRKKGQYIARTLEGKVGDQILLESDTHAERVKAWDLSIEKDDFFSRLELGYSGSPVCDENGNVFAVLSHKRGEKYGHAVCISNLEIICPEIVLDLSDDKNSRPVKSGVQNYGFIRKDYNNKEISLMSNNIKEEQQKKTDLEYDHMSFEQKIFLVDALTECDIMRDRNMRDAVVNNLRGDIKNTIRRDNTTRVDLLNIVGRCMGFSNGISELITIVRSLEGESKGMKKVDAVIKKICSEELINELSPKLNKVEEQMPSEQPLEKTKQTKSLDGDVTTAGRDVIKGDKVEINIENVQTIKGSTIIGQQKGS